MENYNSTSHSVSPQLLQDLQLRVFFGHAAGQYVAAFPQPLLHQHLGCRKIQIGIKVSIHARALGERSLNFGRLLKINGALGQIGFK